MNRRTMNRLALRHRTGLSLIELVVVMSACAVLLTLSATFLQRAFLAQVRSRTAAHLHLTLLRLEQSVRNDVHGASTAETGDAKLMPGVVLRLENLQDEVIEYRRQGSSLERVQFAAGEIKSRETFSFPREIDPKVLFPQPRLVVLSITADDEMEVDAPPIHVRIETVLQRDRGGASIPDREDADE